MKISSVAELDNIDDAEIQDELIVENILDKLPFSEAAQFIHTLCKKLGHGGKLVIQANDMLFASKLLASRKITIEEGNALFYGDLRCSSYSAQYLESTLRENGLKIMKSRMVGTSALVVGERP